MQSQNIQASSNLDALKSPVLQAELLDASDIIALQLAESERTDSVKAAGDAERINLDELLENDFASLTTSLTCLTRTCSPGLPSYRDILSPGARQRWRKRRLAIA